MLVSPQELETLIREDAVRIFDCRFSLTDTVAGLRQYQHQHIPGAMYLDLERDLSAPASLTGGRHPLPNPLDFAMTMSQKGVSDATKVVFYDAGEGMAARGWWLMRYIGHQQVYLLNGGYEGWRQHGLDVTDTLPAPQVQRLSVSLQTQMVASEEDIEHVVQSRQTAILLDARAAVRYRGDEEPIDPKAGHIPGARNAPWTQGSAENGMWLTAAEQRQRFESVVRETGDVIHYCGSGVTACNNVFAMELAGMPSSRLYPGSWSQWSGKDYHPVEVGD